MNHASHLRHCQTCRAGQRRGSQPSLQAPHCRSSHHLAWSSARFRASSAWQRLVLPAEVCGGVSGRRVDDITHHLALGLHEANEVFAGIQIDRSKCFDRLYFLTTPSLSSRLWVSLHLWPRPGAPTTVLFGIHPTPLANCNGIAQGCSLSVLAAINVLMAAWVLLILRHFPGVEPRVYVAIPSLVQAVRATSLLVDYPGVSCPAAPSGPPWCAATAFSPTAWRMHQLGFAWH